MKILVNRIKDIVRELYKVMFTEIRQKMIRYSSPFDTAWNFKWNITELLKNLVYLHSITCDLNKFRYFRAKLHLHKPQPLGKFATARIFNWRTHATQLSMGKISLDNAIKFRGQLPWRKLVDDTWLNRILDDYRPPYITKHVSPTHSTSSVQT